MRYSSPNSFAAFNFFRKKVENCIADIVELQPTSSFTFGGRSDRAKIVPEMSRWITVIGQSSSPDFNSTATHSKSVYNCRLVLQIDLDLACTL